MNCNKNELKWVLFQWKPNVFGFSSIVAGSQQSIHFSKSFWMALNKKKGKINLELKKGYLKPFPFFYDKRVKKMVKGP